MAFSCTLRFIAKHFPELKTRGALLATAFLFTGCMNVTIEDLVSKNTPFMKIALHGESSITLEEGVAHQITVALEALPEGVQENSNAESLRWTLQDAEGDFEVGSGSFIVNPTTTSVSFVIKPLKDAFIESDEKFVLKFRGHRFANLEDSQVEIIVQDKTTHALLTSSVSNLNFGARLKDSTTEAAITITNTGDATATDISWTNLSGPFSYKGGAFPGSGGTCNGTVLDGHQSCTLIVTYTPSQVSSHTSALAWNYKNPEQVLNGSLNLSGSGVEVAATLADTPTSPSNIDQLGVTVSGLNITHYRYKVGPASTTNCSLSSGYSTETAVSVKVTDNINSFGNQSLKLCVIGKDDNNLWQDYNLATSHTWNLDTASPAVIINQKVGQSDPTNSLPIRFVITFSEPIVESSLTNGDINFVGTAVIDNFSIAKVDDTHYELIVSILGADGTVIPELQAHRIYDLAGNENTASTSADNSVTYDSAAPTAPITLGWLQSSPTNAVPMTASWTPSTSTDVSSQRIQFFQDSLCLTSLGAPISLGDSVTTQNLNGTQGSTYAYQITTLDQAGNSAISSCSSSITFDSAAPTVLAFVPAATTFAALPTTLTVQFSKTMAAASLENLSHWIVQCSGSGVVSVTGASASGPSEATLNLNVVNAPADAEVCTVRATSSLEDAAGNTMATDATVAYTLDLPGTVLQVSSSLADGNYKTGDIIPVAVQFTEPVFVNTAGGTPSLALELGSTDRFASYIAGSGTDTLHFSYIVVSGDNSPDLDYEGPTALALNGATLKDSFGSDMNTDLPTPGEMRSLSANKNILIDTQAPDAFDILGIAGGTDSTEDEWLTNGTVASVRWDEAVGSARYIVELRSDDGSISLCAPASTTSTFHAFTDCPVNNGDSYQVLLKAQDEVGNETVAANSPFIFTVNTSAVIATLANQPTGKTNHHELDITVSGNDIISYRYKIGPSATTVCSNAAGYSSETLVAEHITSDIMGYGDGAIRLCVIGKNSANVEQLMASATSATWTQDLTAPTVELNQKVGQADPTSILPIEFAVVFSEAINPSTFTVSDITQTGTASGITWALSTSDNITYSLKATAITTPGTVKPRLLAGAVKDIAGNNSHASNSTDADVVYELTKPSLTINQKSGQADPTNALPIAFSIVFSEAINPSSFTSADITQTGTAAGITWVLSTSDNTTYELTATAVTTPGTLIPTVTANKVTDIAGNQNIASTSTDGSVTYDLTAPTNASSLAWQQTSPTNATSLVASWTASVSADLSAQKVRYYTGSSCNTYTGTENSVNSSTSTNTFVGVHGSTYTYQIVSVDLAGNSSTSACSSAITIDTASPTISNVTSNTPSGAYTVGTVIDVRVTFTENVTVTGTPVLALNTTPARNATYASGSGSNTLVFNYTIAATDTTADLNYAATTSLTVPSATIKDAAGNNATLTLPALAAAGSLGTNKNIIVDTTAPTISSFAVTNSSPTNSTTFNITSAVAGSPSEYCILVNNTSVGACSWVSGSTLPSSFVVSTVNESKTLSAWVRDAAGNVSARSAASAIVFDNTPPTATLSGHPTGSTNVYVLNATVGGTDVVAYKYKVGPSASTDCTIATGYSASEIPVATKITNNISALANGTIKLCVVGRDTAGNWQTEASATSVTWTKNSPNIQFAATTSSVSEYNDPSHKVTVSIPAAAAVAVSVNYAFSNGASPSATLGTDYTGVNSTLTIPAGSTSAQISIPIIDNPNEENDETFKITLSSPQGSYLGTNTVHTVTILDDEDPPLVTIQDVYVLEGATTSLKATLSHATDKGSVVVSWKRDTCSGVDCAVVTTDYTMATTSGSATIPSGSTSVTFGSVTTINNTVDELYKRIPISITGVTGGTSYISQADIFINDNDVPTGKNITELAAGELFACALAGNGKVYCWGHGDLGQLGNGDAYASTSPVEVILPTTATKITAAWGQACALLNTGAAYCWGRGSHGDHPGAGFTGTGTTGNRLTPVQVVGLSSAVTDISMGANNGCVIHSGAVKCWGSSLRGILGNPGSTSSTTSPVAISVLTSGVSKISVGWVHACAIKSGALYCWGENTNGEVGNGTTTMVYTPTLISGLGTVTDVWAGVYGTCAKNSSNQVYCWGNNSDWQMQTGTTVDKLSPYLMTEFAGATKIDFGATTCATLSSVLKCKGRNYYGEMGLNEPTDYSIYNLTTVPGATASINTFSVSNDGFMCFSRSSQVYCTGYAGYGQLGDAYQQQNTSHILSPDFTNASTITIGYENACGLYSGAVKCIGDNTHYRLGATLAERIYYAPVVVKTLESGVSKVQTAHEGGCALKGTTLYCWGRYWFRGGSTSGNPISMLTSVTDFDAQPTANIFCAVVTGRVYCWGDLKWLSGALGFPAEITSAPVESTDAGSNNAKVIVGGNHICVLKTNKTVWCAGRGNEGQLGQGTTATSATLVQVPGVTAVDELAVSSRGACARSGTSVKCWGEYSGDGNTKALSPVALSLTGVSKVVGGNYASCAIASGKAYCWGYNRFNQHGLNDAQTVEYRTSPAALTTLNSKGTVTDIAIGAYGTCGKVGSNWYCAGAEIGGNLGTDKKPNRLGAVSIAPF